ncbi:MAG: bifunctional 1-(5-phosphoribosyl)-5-((5-phosphoribosylamino)methylideneamino)imidazole-4-carboxamide isomerase/phosphoribosylanthranilate isomerase PriA [Propionibacteriaceae bacterium]|jgi:phosphoribosylanthranilate isomerase|nr:bifunctional 1-(5-phosphoribosyl)-5-((5-phosphoribosylamino)methylideneamino)imidazole-4-carboxamide isomerase/phosphoribosylanthranilate isomerase PriA [Propionibacteriaceae bacterium]
MGKLTVIPAVDLQGGQAVQLVQGVAGSAKVFGDPLAAAQRWAAEGAQWLHVVDLDRAFGTGSNAEIAAEITRTLNLNVELTGGIRDTETLNQALATGCARVNIGTAAVTNPAWAADAIQTHGERIAIALDVRDGQLATHGWVDQAGDLFDTIELFDAIGCARYVVTDVSSDGTLTGPNLDLLRLISADTSTPITASGGISTLADLEALATIPTIDSAIVGTALYLGHISFADVR